MTKDHFKPLKQIISAIYKITKTILLILKVIKEIISML